MVKIMLQIGLAGWSSFTLYSSGRHLNLRFPDRREPTELIEHLILSCGNIAAYWK